MSGGVGVGVGAGAGGNAGGGEATATRLFRLGTRGSDLALWQARRVAGLLAERAGARVEVVIVKTSGDQDQLSPLRAIGGAGAFTKELEDRLLAGEIDLAVHSLKDLPTRLDPRLRLAAIPERADVRDVLIARVEAVDPARAAAGAAIPLRQGARVGSSSLRRRALLASARPDLDLVDIRGNVPTRVDKARRGVVDATVLARAGLERLGLDLGGLAALPLDPTVFVPAPGQGALAIECRAADPDLIELLERCVHDRRAARAVAAERLLLGRLEGGCTVPLGAHATAAREPARKGGGARGLAAGGQPRPPGGVGPGLADDDDVEGALVLRAALGDPDAPLASLCRALVRAPSAAAAAEIAFRALGGEALSTGGGLGTPGAGGSPDPSSLGGLRVALTRAEGRGDALAGALARAGVAVVIAPAIETARLASGAAVAADLDALPEGAWVLLTSAAAADALADALREAGREPASTSARLRVGAVGAATAQALAGSGIVVDLVGRSGGEALAADVIAADAADAADAAAAGGAAEQPARPSPEPRPRTAWLPQAREPRAELGDRLAAAGYAVRRLALYETRPLSGARYPEGADLALVASPSAARALGRPPAGVRVVAIGATTAAQLRALGVEPAAVAAEPSPAGQLSALIAAAKRRA